MNCKTDQELRETLSRHFATLAFFSMNDEVVHTGFGPMSHYFMVVCSSKRR